MLRKITGILLVIGILFSYIPMIPMDDCPEGHHMGNVKMDCGYCFHCPILLGMNVPEPLPLPFSGRLVLSPSLPKVDELIRLIYHPPKYQT